MKMADSRDVESRLARELFPRRDVAILSPAYKMQILTTG